MIVGVAGACRCDELTKMVLQDVEDKGNVLVINIPNSKTNKPRYFVVSGEGENNYNINLYRKYLALRPPHTPHQRLFLSYRQGKCSIQPVGIHTFGKIPKMIASYLGLAEPILYTGHCLRRTSATLLVDAGGDLATLKRHGGWRSGTVAEGYIEQSLTNKLEVARKIENRGTDNDGGNSNIYDISQPSTSKNHDFPISDRNATSRINTVVPKTALSGINISNVENSTININVSY